MSDYEECLICKNIIPKNMDICPSCGNIVIRSSSDDTRNTADKKMEQLEHLDLTLSNLEHELDAILCKKR
ncbi:MAG: hypothetical protein OCD02_22555 [Spirochaetaceae bacterium]